eukprot:7260972-Alexandrium_andersonii.AAC.1
MRWWLTVERLRGSSAAVNGRRAKLMGVRLACLDAPRRISTDLDGSRWGLDGPRRISTDLDGALDRPRRISTDLDRRA